MRLTPKRSGQISFSVPRKSPGPQLLGEQRLAHLRHDSASTWWRCETGTTFPLAALHRWVEAHVTL